MTVERVNPEVVLKAAQVAGVPRGLESRFMPQTNGEDAWALERALKKEGWSFGLSGLHDNSYWAAHNLHNTKYDDSDTVLLLACVSSQFSIPLYLENT